LDVDFLEGEHPDPDVKNGRKLLLKARIQGIDRISVCRAYAAVERDLGRGPNGGPREAVIRLLEQREEFLQQHGEREDHWSYGPRRPPEMFDSESRIEERPATALDKMQSQQVATDGGERSDE
jgi:hypothetical protein